MALPGGEGGVVVEVGGGGGGGGGVDVPPGIPTLPGASVALDVPVKGIGGRRLFEATADDERCHRKNRRRAAPSNACCFYRKWSRLGSAFLVSCAPGTVNGLRRTRGSVRIHVLTVDVMRKN